MQRPYDVLFWMVGQECMKKKKSKKNQEKYKKMRKRKVEKKHTDYHPVSFYVYFMFLLFCF
jgi:hypothetical protein